MNYAAIILNGTWQVTKNMILKEGVTSVCLIFKGFYPDCIYYTACTFLKITYAK